MDQKNITLKCFRCGGQHPVLSMVVDASGKGMACRPCAGLAPRGDGRRPRFSRTPEPRRSYQCKDCQYKFNSSKPVGDVICGYCSSENVVLRKEVSASALLRD